jgi:uncharacterized protein (TIGR02147 family)
MDYRQYLRDFYLWKKATRPQYSYRVFTMAGNLGSPSHLKMVIDGQRNLTEKTIPFYSKALGFTKKQETCYFASLVRFNQARTEAEKLRLLQDLFEQQRRVGVQPIEASQLEFILKWQYVAIYVLAGTRGFRADPQWISRRLKNRISPAEALHAFEVTQRLGLVALDAEGRWRQTRGALDTTDEISTLAATPYHRDQLRLGAQILETETPTNREFAGITLSLPQAKLNELKEKIRAFRRDINEFCSSLEAADQVFQLNLQFFPLSEVIDE